MEDPKVLDDGKEALLTAMDRMDVPCDVIVIGRQLEGEEECFVVTSGIERLIAWGMLHYASLALSALDEEDE